MIYVCRLISNIDYAIFLCFVNDGRTAEYLAKYWWSCWASWFEPVYSRAKEIMPFHISHHLSFTQTTPSPILLAFIQNVLNALPFIASMRTQGHADPAPLFTLHLLLNCKNATDEILFPWYSWQGRMSWQHWSKKMTCNVSVLDRRWWDVMREK